MVRAHDYTIYAHLARRRENQHAYAGDMIHHKLTVTFRLVSPLTLRPLA